MKYLITWDEIYPVCFLEKDTPDHYTKNFKYKNFYETVDLTDEEFAKYCKVRQDFFDMEDLISNKRELIYS